LGRIGQGAPTTPIKTPLKQRGWVKYSTVQNNAQFTKKGRGKQKRNKNEEINIQKLD